jgi:signal transduction histidine kinase/CheY-like chemotaxis protein
MHLADSSGPPDADLEVAVHRLIAGVAHDLMIAAPGDVDAIIRAGLRSIARRLGVQRGYVFLLTTDETALAGAVEWCAEGVLQHDFEAFKGVPVTAFPWTMEHLNSERIVVVQDPAALVEAAAPERGACEAMSINDYVNAGLRVGDRLLGWLGFDSVGSHRLWSERDLVLVREASAVMAAGLERKRRDLLLQREQEVSNRAAAVGTLAAGLAHEINNPLTYLIGNLFLIEDWLDDPRGTPPDELRDILRQTRTGANRIRGIVRDLGSLTDVDAPDTATVDVKAVLDSTLRMVSTDLRPRAHAVAEYGALPPVRGNSSQLSQVVLNLLLNALNAIDEGNPAHNRVTVSAEVIGELLEIRVSDTGRGIPERDLARIFDPFFTTADIGMTAGVGLTVSRSIVERLGGTLRAHSVDGEGTTLTLRLPLAAADDQASAAPDSGPTPRRLKVLVVDDEKNMLRWFQRVVRDHDVLTASNGKEALELLRTEDVDLVLCDLMMPLMTGMELYEALRQDRADLLERFTFITGGVFSRAAQDFVDTVPNTVLYKPFGRDVVQEVVDAVAERLSA